MDPGSTARQKSVVKDKRFLCKTIRIFNFYICPFHQLECCHHDRVQISYESCKHGQFPVEVDLTGHRTDTPVIFSLKIINYFHSEQLFQLDYKSPVGVPGMNVRFYANGGAHYFGFRMRWFIID